MAGLGNELQTGVYTGPPTHSAQDLADQQAKQNALQGAINYQKQTPYASKNGMNTGGIQAPAPKPSPASQQATSTASGQSPVMANGRISTTNQAAPAPQAAPQQASPPAAAPPPAPSVWRDVGNNMVYNSQTGQTVDKNHPIYTQSMQSMAAPMASQTMLAPQVPGQMPAPQPGANPQSPAPATPVQSAYASSQPYTMGAQGGQNTLAYHNPLGPDRWSDTLYTPGQLTQNPGSLTPEMEGLVQGALKNAIQGGGGLPVEQLKGRARDDALAMRGDQLSTLDDAMAASGRGNSGWAAGQGQNIRSAATSDILGKYRDVDIADAQSRLDNQYKGIQMGSDYLTGSASRNLADWAATHQGEMDQEDLMQKAAANSRENYLADLGGAGTAASAAAATHGADVSADASKYGARLGLTSDLLRIMEQARQSDQSTALGWGNTMAGLMGRI
jgi:hypothetical protein